MQGKIKIVKHDDKIMIRISKNSDITDIMKDNHGWFYYKEKSWVFPYYKLDKVKIDLEEHGYNTEVMTIQKIRGERNTKQVSLDRFFKDPSVVYILGDCIICKNKTYINCQMICKDCEKENKKEE